MRDSQQKNWMKLDNAATIYPAARSRRWMALFRLSATLSDPVEPELLKKALNQTLPRFPSFAQKLKKGLFWNYFEKNEQEPVVEMDVQNPCMCMDFRETRGFMFRVRYHNCRIAVEYFHALTDGTGGKVFLLTLVAQYLELRYKVVIPRGGEILNVRELPRQEELEDKRQAQPPREHCVSHPWKTRARLAFYHHRHDSAGEDLAYRKGIWRDAHRVSHRGAHLRHRRSAGAI